jgi:hypothetical protein
MAAVRVVLPWSMCPIVPTLTWTFYISDNSLVAPSNHSGEIFPSPNRHRDLFSTPSETRARKKHNNSQSADGTRRKWGGFGGQEER